MNEHHSFLTVVDTDTFPPCASHFALRLASEGHRAGGAPSSPVPQQHNCWNPDGRSGREEGVFRLQQLPWGRCSLSTGSNGKVFLALYFPLSGLRVTDETLEWYKELCWLGFHPLCDSTRTILLLQNKIAWLPSLNTFLCFKIHILNVFLVWKFNNIMLVSISVVSLVWLVFPANHYVNKNQHSSHSVWVQ